MTEDRVVRTFTLSAKFEEFIGEYATKHNLAIADLVRQAVAKYINYDLSQEPKRKRRVRKYNTETERKSAMSNAAKERQILVKKLINAQRDNEKRKMMEMMEKSIK